MLMQVLRQWAESLQGRWGPVLASAFANYRAVPNMLLLLIQVVGGVRGQHQSKADGNQLIGILTSAPADYTAATKRASAADAGDWRC